MKLWMASILEVCWNLGIYKGQIEEMPKGEDFAATMKEIHDQGKATLEQSVAKYKGKANLRSRYV